MSKTILLIDSSLMQKSSCLFRVFSTVVSGYKQPVNSVQIEFGQAFHKFRRIYREKKSAGFAEAVTKALEYFDNTKYEVPPHKKYMDRNYLAEVCTSYMTKHKEDEDLQLVCVDDKPLLELKLKLPYYEDDDVEVFLCGTIDEVAKMRHSIYVIADCKTTSRFDIEGFKTDFYLSGQLLFYYFLVHRQAETEDSYMSTIVAKDLGLLVDAVYLKGRSKFECQRSTVWVPSKETLEEYIRTLKFEIQRLIDAVKVWRQTSREPDRTGILYDACDDKYNNAKCPFFRGCILPDTQSRTMLFERQMIKKFYNPLEWQE